MIFASTAYEPAYACTASGARFNLMDPMEHPLPPWYDFALQLARIIRFNGAVNVDVATHSIALCVLMPSAYRLRALLHDASEAILGDMIRPLKRSGLVQPFQDLESLWQTRIYAAKAITGPDPAALRHYDACLVRYEAEQFGERGVADCVDENIPHGTRLTGEEELRVGPLYRDHRTLTPEQRAHTWLQYVESHTGHVEFSS